MQHDFRAIIAVAGAALLLAACDKGVATSPAKAAAPAAAAPQQPGAVRRITLKEAEVKSLGIAFAEVTKDGERLTAPYGALLYDANGGEWIFINPEPAVFTRSPIKVESIVGDKMYLARGPDAGTKLVTHGAAELYGIEFGVGK